KLTLTAKPKDFSPLTVRAPVHITGSFSDPDVAPDAKTLGVKAVAAAVLAAINPLAALIPLMDPADPATQQCADVLESGRRSVADPGQEGAADPEATAQPNSSPRERQGTGPDREPMQ